MNEQFPVDKLKSLIKELGLSTQKASDFIFFEENDITNEIERKQFFEKFKKQLSRKTTKIEIIENYYRTLTLHPYFSNKGQFSPPPLNHYYLSEFAREELIVISKEISDSIESEQYENENEDDEAQPI